MRLTRVTAPTGAAISAADVKPLLSIEHPDDDVLIETFVGAVTDYLDGPAGILGRAIVSQEWLLELERWPDRLSLPLEPVTSVAVSWFDAADTETTLAATNYEIVSAPGSRVELVWTDGAVLPDLGARMFPVRVAITAGYADAASVPEGLRHVMSLLAAFWFDNRGSISSPAAVELPFGISAQLARYRVHL